MKRIFKLLLIIVVAITISTEFYWFFKNDGNLIIYIQNQSDKQELIEVKVKINKKQIFSGELKRNEIIPKEINMISGLGKKIIVAAREDNLLEVEQEL